MSTLLELVTDISNFQFFLVFCSINIEKIFYVYNLFVYQLKNIGDRYIVAIFFYKLLEFNVKWLWNQIIASKVTIG